MRPIVILTDSAADIEVSLRESLGIEMVPLKVIFGEETYLDGVTIQPSGFFRKLESSNVLPSTSQPSPLDFLEAYKRIIEKHGTDVQIICIMLASVLSGTYQSAVIAKTMLEEEVDITIIDSKKASLLHGLAAIEAARAVQAGKSKQEIIDMVERLLKDIQVFFLVDTLEYLQKGGRIGKAQALIGSLLNIKPILTLEPDGHVTPFDKVRGTKKAINRILEEAHRYAGDDAVKVIIVHGDALEAAQDLMERIKGEFNVAESMISDIGPVIATHGGPGLLGCMVVRTKAYQ